MRYITHYINTSYSRKSLDVMACVKVGNELEIIKAFLLYFPIWYIEVNDKIFDVQKRDDTICNRYVKGKDTIYIFNRANDRNRNIAFTIALPCLHWKEVGEKILLKLDKLDKENVIDCRTPNDSMIIQPTDVTSGDIFPKTQETGIVFSFLNSLDCSKKNSFEENCEIALIYYPLLRIVGTTNKGRYECVIDAVDLEIVNCFHSAQFGQIKGFPKV